MDKSIYKYNNKGQWNGYIEWYNSYGVFCFRGNCKNNLPIGYKERHNHNKETTYHIK
jgi:hypothetical protein